MKTTIRASKTLVQELENEKLIERETLEQVILRLLKSYREKEVKE